MWWSAQASSRRCASNSTGCERLGLQTKKPAAAAQNPPTIQRTFFIFGTPFTLTTTMRLAGLDAAKFCCVAGLRAQAFASAVGRATLLSMDSVRFGRALGVGARAAAKTLVTAVDAATSPNPSAAVPAKQTESKASAGTTVASTEGKAAGVRLGEQTARTTAQVRQTGQGLKQGSKRFGDAVGGRLVKLSGVLWLELTGVFFGIFAVFAAGNTWKTHSALHETGSNHDAHVRFVIAAAMTVVFGYFCASSFVKANRRSRGH